MIVCSRLVSVLIVVLGDIDRSLFPYLLFEGKLGTKSTPHHLHQLGQSSAGAATRNHLLPVH